jgi:hypothetical protein
MNRSTYRSILFTVGSLPFWTGKNKLIRLLHGDPGSYWKGETPLKKVYLNLPFFGELSDLSKSDVRRSLQNLINADHLVRETISGDKPYLVVKFSDKGVKKFYNLLVMERGLSEPHWWLHHVSRIRNQPRSAINTGGELLEYNDTLYLTQTPAYRSQTERIQSDQTVPIKQTNSLDSRKGHYEFRNLVVKIDNHPLLYPSDDTIVERVNAGDLGRKLSHFGTEESQVNPPDPYVIRGRLVEASEPDAEGTRNLTFRNSEDDEVIVTVKTSQIPEELSLQESKRYVIGPVTENTNEKESTPSETRLTLEESGQLRATRS